MVIQSVNPARLEKELHTEFADRNIGNEWFRLSQADISKIYGIAIRYEEAYYTGTNK